MKGTRYTQSIAALLLALTSCGGEPGGVREGQHLGAGGKADEATPTATTLIFDSQWRQTAKGQIIAGGQIAIDYDEARLPECRASHNGSPGWQIYASALFLPGKQQQTVELFAHRVGTTGSDPYSWERRVPTVDVPADAEEVQLWFKNTSGFDHPCTRWDSAFGRNYRFAVQQAAGPTLTFHRQWTVERKGELAPGGTLTIVYDADRMQDIANGTGHVSFFASKYHCYGYGCCSFDYQNRLHVRFRAADSFTAHSLQAPVSLSIPTDAERVELYFATDVYTTTWYCGGSPGPRYTHPQPDRFYDSNYGKNFLFVL